MNLFRRRRRDREFDAELDAPLGLMQEEWQARIFHWLEMLEQDVRFALRTLRKNPGFTAVAVLTLALGIGGTTAIFTLVQQVMLRSLPVAQPEQLWRVGDAVQCCFSNGYTQGDGRWLPLNDWSLFSWEAYKVFRADTPAFEELAAFEIGEHNAELAVRRAGSRTAVEPRNGEYVSGNFFETFGISAWRGHLFTDADDQEGAPPVAVMSYHTWEGEYGSDPSVIGATYDLNGHPFAIIGVGPPGFFGAKIDASSGSMPDFWLPLTTEPLIAGATSRLKNPRLAWLDLIGRVRPGVRPKTLQAQMQVELHQWLASHVPDMTQQETAMWEKQTVKLVPGGAGVSLMRQAYENGLRLLMAAAFCVLLVACANIANLLLARGLRNRHQTAVRVALGASRGRLVRKALAESVTLSLFGAVAGSGIAYASAKLILRLAFGGPDNWIPIDATPSTVVLLFALGVSLLTGVVFGMVPAWMTSRPEPVEALRGANRTVGRHRSIFKTASAQKTLVIVQAGLSLVLLSAAAMLGRSLRNLQHLDYGFDTSGRYLVSIDPKVSNYTPQQLAQLFNEIESHLRAIPGVRAVGSVLEAPQNGWVPGHDIRIEGKPDDDGSSGWTRVTPGFFETFGESILMGRAISDDDNAATRPVAVVNEAFVKKFDMENPVGQHFGPLPEKNEAMYEIVGVTRDIDFADGVQPMYFLPESQATQFNEPESESREVWSHYLYNIVIWAPGNLPNMEAQVKRALADAAPDLIAGGTVPYSETIRGKFSQENMIATLTWLFGGVGLVLAAVGLYGVTSYGVEQRTSEIGVRMALGANRGSILRMVVGEGMLLALIGIAVGIVCALVLGRFLRSELFGIAPNDPVTFASVALGFALVAFTACYLPARRAMRVDPASAMRCA